MSFDAVKHLFGHFSEVAVLAIDRNVLVEKRWRGPSAFFMYLTWTIIGMRDLKQHMLL